MTKSLKSLCLIYLFIMLSLLFIINCSAEGWYVSKENENGHPKLPAEWGYINELGGYYVDLKAESNDKVIYLTFDAGYENGNIERILDVLKKHEAKGAFFVLKNLIKQNTDLVLRMTTEGHTVCNHTSKHKDMSKICNIESFKAELCELENIYKEYTGLELSKFYRPPEGKFSKQNLEFAKALGYKTVFWSFAYADWDNNKQPDREYALNKLKSNTHNGMVVLLHPTSSTNADIMDEILTYWENEGYRFGTLDELTRE